MNINTLQEIYKNSINENYGFYVFCDLFARIVEPKACFDEKVYQVIQDGFQYFSLDEIPESLFLLETAPRTGKSLITTILGATYIGLRNARKNGLIITSSIKTMKDFYTAILSIIQNPFFLNITNYNIKDFIWNGGNFIEFPNKFKLTFQTTNSQTPLGKGFHFIWLDDFLTHEDTISEARSYRADAKLTSIMTRRMYNVDTKKADTKVIVSNQRLGFNDVSARFIESYKKADIPFIHLTLPYHFKISGEKEYKLYNGKTIHFLHNEYLRSVFNAKDENDIKAKLNNEARFMTEYLQIPTQMDTQIFDISKLNYYNDFIEIKNITNVFITADIAFGVNKNNDYTAIIVWGADLMDSNKPKLYALDIIHHRKILEDTITVLDDVYYRWKEFKGINKYISAFHGLCLENVTSNEGVFLELKKHSKIDTIQKLSRASNDKIARANFVASDFHKGVVYLPSTHKHTPALVNELRQFSRNNTHKHDDLVDCVIDAIHWGVKMQIGNSFDTYIKAMNEY